MIKYAMAGGTVLALANALRTDLNIFSFATAALVGFLWGTFLCWVAGRGVLWGWRTIRRVRLVQR